MLRRNPALGLLALLVSGCAFTPSQLNANPTHYNGLVVVVRGFVKLTHDAHALYEPGRSGPELRTHQKYCLTIANPELLEQNRKAFNGRTITVQGKFMDDYPKMRRADGGACPLPTAIVIDDPALAQRYPGLLSGR